jgi:hypothetical protein
MARPKKDAAAAPKSTRKKKGETETVVADAIKMISAKKLNALINEKRAAYKESRSISGEIGAAIKEAAENDHLHKKAFAIVSGLDRLEPEPLADLLAHLDDASGLRKRAGSVIRMNLSGEENEPVARFGDAGERTSNVKQFPQAAAE